jgi:hypothetical protein
LRIHDRLREVKVTGAIFTCFCSLLFGIPFGVAWALDDGSDNQPFPKVLRQFVLALAVIHFASVGHRLLRAVWKWEPVLPIVGKLLSAYGLIAATFAIGWALHLHGARALAHVVLVLPAGWGFWFLGSAMTPGIADGRRQPEQGVSG